MRVAFNGKVLGHPEKGGAARMAAEIVRAIARQRPDLDLEVLVPTGPGQRSVPELPDGVRVRRFESSLHTTGAGRSVWEQLALPRKIGSGAFDVVMNLTNSAPVLLSRRVPQLVVVHDVGFLNRSWYAPSYSRYVETVIRAAARRGAVLVTISEASARDLRAAFPEARRVEVVLIDADRPPEDVPELDLPQPFVLVLGSLNPRKNLAGAIAGFRRFAERSGDPYWLLVVGGGKKIFGALGGGVPNADRARIRFEGYVSDVERWAYYRAARALLIPSHLEGFGLPILEALRVGTPVVASDLPVIRELYGDSVVRVDPGSPADIAAGLARACEDEADRGERIRLGLEVSDRYSWERAARRYVELLAEVAGAR